VARLFRLNNAVPIHKLVESIRGLLFLSQKLPDGYKK
jgi:hypothetical protein